ncbi:uncharacterized protein [Apostichopus japonicus]|uniref:uncharacterized protein n=1 Tax=Stichopus japonicus TaxID=307972 RepID=UPI003AB6A69A
MTQKERLREGFVLILFLFTSVTEGGNICYLHERISETGFIFRRTSCLVDDRPLLRLSAKSDSVKILLNFVLRSSAKDWDKRTTLGPTTSSVIYSTPQIAKVTAVASTEVPRATTVTLKNEYTTEQITSKEGITSLKPSTSDVITTTAQIVKVSSVPSTVRLTTTTSTITDDHTTDLPTSKEGITSLKPSTSDVITTTAHIVKVSSVPSTVGLTTTTTTITDDHTTDLPTTKVSTRLATSTEPPAVTSMVPSYAEKSTLQTTVSGGFTTKVAAPCAKWTDFGITSYCMSDIQLSWTEAAESCRLPPNNGHLVYIETEEENKEIVSFYDAVDRNGVNWCWIGIEDSLIEGEWRYEDGRSPAYVHWIEDEPNGNTDGRGDQDCALINNIGGYRDYPCNEPLYFICER